MTLNFQDLHKRKQDENTELLPRALRSLSCRIHLFYSFLPAKSVAKGENLYAVMMLSPAFQGQYGQHEKKKNKTQERAQIEVLTNNSQI